MEPSRTWRRSPTPEKDTSARVWKPQPKARLWAPSAVPGREATDRSEGSKGGKTNAVRPQKGPLELPDTIEDLRAYPVPIRTDQETNAYGLGRNMPEPREPGVSSPARLLGPKKNTAVGFDADSLKVKAGNSRPQQAALRRQNPEAGMETPVRSSQQSRSRGGARPAPRPLDDEAEADISACYPDFASPCAVSEPFFTPQSTHGAEGDGLQWELLEAVQPFSESIQASRRLKHLMGTASRLSLDVFGDDALATVTRKAKWQLNIIACLDDDWPTLLGFIVYRLRPELQCLSIAKMAVVPEHRRKGYGARLIESCVNLSQRRPEICFLALSSLPEAVTFYQRLGFRRREVQGPLMREDVVEGQVYMEKSVKGRAGRRKAGR